MKTHRSFPGLACLALAACSPFVRGAESQPPAAPVAMSTARPTPAVNLLRPIDEVTSWQFELIEDATGTLKAADGVVGFTVTKADGVDWHVQAYQVGLGLEDGKEYVVTFRAKASARRVAQVYAGINEDDYHSIGLDAAIDLTAEWKPFRFTFKVDGAVPKNNRLGFVLGQEPGTVYVKDMTLAPR